MGVPLLEQGVGHQIAEGDWLHGLVLLQGVQVDLLFHQGRECLHVGAQPTQSHYDIVLHLEHSLEVIGQGQQLFTESTVAGNPHAVLAHHAHKGASIVFVDRHCLF